MIFDKHRFEIWTQAQHPYKHSLADFAYVNPALPGVSDVNSAINWLVKVLYPNSKPTVADPASLPLTGNALNDYRVVLDDGDGKQAGYRWEQREGEVVASWHKVFDFDWSTDSILAAFQDIAQDLYVYQKGKSDLDGTGTPIAGVFAGQTVNGGNLANQNLTLKANSGDGTGTHTGFVQTDDNFRPTLDATYKLGALTERFLEGYFSSFVQSGTLTLSGGSIVDSSGIISLGATNLTTTGTVTANIGLFPTRVEVGPLAGNALIFQPGSIVDESGTIDFGTTNLTTSGIISASDGSVLGDLTFGIGEIISGSNAIDFGSGNLSTTGTLVAGDASFTRVDTDNVRIDGNTISATNANGSLDLSANGTGFVTLLSPASTQNINTTGNIIASGIVQGGNVRLSGNSLISANTNGDVILAPNGTGNVVTSGNLNPNTNGILDLGTPVFRFKDIYLSGGVRDGVSFVTSGTLVSLKDINTGATAGMTLFYNGTAWLPSLPDTEINHTTISGLVSGDSGHTQFLLLAGRNGGQDAIGGTLNGDNLNLESTSSATKGFIQLKDNTRPFTDAVFSGSWAGVSLGDASHSFNDVYTKGEFKGFRFENFTVPTLPSASANNKGHAVWATDTNKIYIDTGGSWIPAGSGKFVSDTSWNGTDVTKDVTVSGNISDARLAMWALHDNTNDFERIYCSIKSISLTQVRITVSPALPAGSYRLIGIE
jgi:hypothetical protein